MEDEKKKVETIVRFSSNFNRISTCKDGGINLTLSVPDTDKQEASKLMSYDKCYIYDVIVYITKAGV